MAGVVVFVDEANFFKQVQEHCARHNVPVMRPNYTDLGQKLAGDRQLVRLYLYTAPLKSDGTQKSDDMVKGQQRFLNALRTAPYVEVRYGRMVTKGDTFVQKGVDVALAVDMLSMAYKDLYDVAVLLSSDSDLVSAVQNVKDLGKHVELGLCSGTKAYHLTSVCDRAVDLDPILHELCSK